MSYMLLRRETNHMVYRVVRDCNEIMLIEELAKSMVKGGCPVDDLKIVENIPFEFKCAIKFLKEDKDDRQENR